MYRLILWGLLFQVFVVWFGFALDTVCVCVPFVGVVLGFVVVSVLLVVSLLFDWFGLVL